jgi:hypothetical protein
MAAFIAAYFQPFGTPRDFEHYDGFLDALRYSGFGLWDTQLFDLSRFEVGFTVVALGLSAIFTSNLAVHGAVGAVSVFLKAAVLRLRASTAGAFYLVMLLYFARYLPIHELTQWRAALSAAFLIIAFLCLWHGTFAGVVVSLLLAVSFHVSAVIAVPALFIRVQRRLSVLAVGALVFGATLVLSEWSLDYLEERVALVAMYRQWGFGDAPNPMSAALLLDWSLVIFALANWVRLSQSMRHVVFLQIFGMAVFYGALEFPVLAHRVRELLAVFWLFFLVDALKRDLLVRIASIVFIFVSASLYTHLYLLSGEYFR